MSGLLEQFGYAAILLLLVAGGLGVPVPEEATQLTAGVLAHRGVLRFAPAVAIAWLGIVAGDALLFSLARRHGPRVLGSRAVTRVLTRERRASLERHFARHAFWTVFVARHAAALRFPTFALAAATGVRRRTFVLADALSALVSVPLVVGAGYLFSAHLDAVHRDLRIVELAVVAAAALVALALWSRRRGPSRAAPGRR